MTDTRYKLISFKLCPYVQRSVITLLEKGVPHDIEYIDLKNKPDWFLELSPLGKVPILVLGEDVLFESAVINEFLDETTGDERLMPEDAIARARHRAWISVSSEVLAGLFRLQHADDQKSAMKFAQKVRHTLSLFEDELGDGPFFAGEAFSLVDATMASALQRATWCEHIAPELDLFGPLPRVAAWRDALLQRPSVIGSTVEEIEPLFRGYVESMKGRSDAPSWLATRA